MLVQLKERRREEVARLTRLYLQNGLHGHRPQYDVERILKLLFGKIGLTHPIGEREAKALFEKMLIQKANIIRDLEKRRNFVFAQPRKKKLVNTTIVTLLPHL